ncbi:hypothetical protein D3C71_1540070 [compost metagenome]
MAERPLGHRAQKRHGTQRHAKRQAVEAGARIEHHAHQRRRLDAGNAIGAARPGRAIQQDQAHQFPERKRDQHEIHALQAQDDRAQRQRDKRGQRHAGQRGRQEAPAERACGQYRAVGAQRDERGVPQGQLPAARDQRQPVDDQHVQAGQNRQVLHKWPGKPGRDRGHGQGRPQQPAPRGGSHHVGL